MTSFCTHHEICCNIRIRNCFMPGTERAKSFQLSIEVWFESFSFNAWSKTSCSVVTALITSSLFQTNRLHQTLKYLNSNLFSFKIRKCDNYTVTQLQIQSLHLRMSYYFKISRITYIIWQESEKTESVLKYKKLK